MKNNAIDKLKLEDLTGSYEGYYKGEKLFQFHLRTNKTYKIELQPPKSIEGDIFWEEYDSELGRKINLEKLSEIRIWHLLADGFSAFFSSECMIKSLRGKDVNFIKIY